MPIFSAPGTNSIEGQAEGVGEVREAFAGGVLPRPDSSAAAPSSSPRRRSPRRKEQRPSSAVSETASKEVVTVQAAPAPRSLSASFRGSQAGGLRRAAPARRWKNSRRAAKAGSQGRTISLTPPTICEMETSPAAAELLNTSRTTSSTQSSRPGMQLGRR